MSDDYVAPPPEKPTLGYVRPWMVLAAAAVLALLMIPLSIWVDRSLNDANDSLTSANNQNTAIKSQAAPLAGTVQSLCAGSQGTAAAVAAAHSGACIQASKVQSVVEVPEPGPSGSPGLPGTNGQNGTPGRGITSTAIVNGDLVLTYNLPPLTVDVGKVVGNDGKDGRGVTSSAIQNNDLVVSYSDGSSIDVGTVVGKDGAAGTNGTDGQPGKDGAQGQQGCGLTNPHISGTNLVMNYDSNCGSNAGSAVTVGPIPQAAACPDGSTPSTTDITEPSGLSSTTVHGVLVCGS